MENATVSISHTENSTVSSMSHTKKYGHGHGSCTCRACGNSHGLIKKYGLNCCRQCFRSNAKEIGFTKYR